MSPFEAELDLEEIWPRWSRGSRLVVTLYDLIPLIMRERYNADWGYMATAWIARLGLLGSAHQILTISQQTADDAMEHLNVPEERITVIDSGVSDRFSSLVNSREEADSILRSALPKVRPGFLLYVGGVDYRKNLEGAIRGYAELPAPMRDAHQLVIACNLAHHLRFSLRVFARRLGIESRNLLLTGFVSDRDLAALYRSCELFVFPSLYEGAGLPILEAMTCGAPVAASGTSAMPELLGDPEATFDPADPADIARCIREVLETPGKLDALRERSRRRVALYTWERVARAHARRLRAGPGDAAPGPVGATATVRRDECPRCERRRGARDRHRPAGSLAPGRPARALGPSRAHLLPHQARAPDPLQAELLRDQLGSAAAARLRLHLRPLLRLGAPSTCHPSGLPYAVFAVIGIVPWLFISRRSSTAPAASSRTPT